MSAVSCRPPWDPKRLQYRRSTGPTWTPEEWRLLERMRLAGKSNKQISRVLGRTENAIKVAWSRYGPSPEYENIQAYLMFVKEMVTQSLKIINDDPQALERFGAKSKERKE